MEGVKSRMAAQRAMKKAKKLKAKRYFIENNNARSIEEKRRRIEDQKMLMNDQQETIRTLEETIRTLEETIRTLKETNAQSIGEKEEE